MDDDKNNNEYTLKLSEVSKRLEELMKVLFTEENYLSYLATMTRFYRYSTRNTLLIHMQMPEASKINDFHTWKGKYDRYVRKEEKCIRILAPRRIKAAKQEAENENAITKFKLIPTFDISQTDGKPLPELMEMNITQNFLMLADALKRELLLPIEHETSDPDKDINFADNGETVKQQDITVMHTASVVIREITYLKYREIEATHSREEPEPEKYAKTKAFETESVYYSVCLHYSIEVYSVKFENISSWSKERDLTENMQSLDIIRKTVTSVIEFIDEKFTEIATEQSMSMNDNTRSDDESGLTETAVISDKISNNAVVVEKENPEDTESQSDNQAEINIDCPESEYKGIMPDPTIGIPERDQYGYRVSDMLPLTRDRALELFEQDYIIFMLYENNTESMVLDREEIIIGHNYLYGVVRADWEASLEYTELQKTEIKPTKNESATDDVIPFIIPDESEKNIKQQMPIPVFENNKKPPSGKGRPTIINRIKEIAEYQNAGRALVQTGQSIAKE